MNKALIEVLLQMQPEQSTQKFEVVVGVIALVFIGIVAYLIATDIKLRKMEEKK
jgi:hypothetical protein